MWRIFTEDSFCELNQSSKLLVSSSKQAEAVQFSSFPIDSWWHPQNIVTFTSQREKKKSFLIHLTWHCFYCLHRFYGLFSMWHHCCCLRLHYLKAMEEEKKPNKSITQNDVKYDKNKIYYTITRHPSEWAKQKNRIKKKKHTDRERVMF